MAEEQGRRPRKSKKAKKARAKKAKTTLKTVKSDEVKKRGVSDHLSDGARAYYTMRVAELYCQGKTIRAIAETLSNEPFGPDAEFNFVSRGIVHRLLVDIRAEWSDRTFRAIKKHKAEELAKLDHLEMTYWDAWEKSVEVEKVKVKREPAIVHDQDGNAHILNPTKTDGSDLPIVERTVEQNAIGDIRFLQGVERCITKRCEIIGLNKVLPQTGEDEDFNEIWKGIESNLKSEADIKAALAFARAIPDDIAVVTKTG